MERKRQRLRNKWGQTRTPRCLHMHAHRHEEIVNREREVGRERNQEGERQKVGR